MGAAIGALAVVVAILLLGFFLLRRNRRRRQKAAEQVDLDFRSEKPSHSLGNGFAPGTVVEPLELPASKIQSSTDFDRTRQADVQLSRPLPMGLFQNTFPDLPSQRIVSLAESVSGAGPSTNYAAGSVTRLDSPISENEVIAKQFAIQEEIRAQVNNLQRQMDRLREERDGQRREGSAR